MKDLEDKALKLQKENLKVIVICSGIWYGNGENIFKHHFKVLLNKIIIDRVLGYKIQKHFLILVKERTKFPPSILAI
jgi:hypothetical protein